jgi:hypothetical protein
VPPARDAAMIGIRLPQAEAERRAGLFRSTGDCTPRDRHRISLMARLGRPRKDIASVIPLRRELPQRLVDGREQAGRGFEQARHVGHAVECKRRARPNNPKAEVNGRTFPVRR